MLTRFVGPATTVEIHCVVSPRIEVRTLGEAISETGRRFTRLVLTPQQVDLLSRELPRVFLTGPPGTGKSVVLVLKGLGWVRCGYDVHVISKWEGDKAAAWMIFRQLQWTVTKDEYQRIHRHQFDLSSLKRNAEGKSEMDIAIDKLSKLQDTHNNRLCLIIDEIDEKDQDLSVLYQGLLNRVTNLYVWAASVWKHNIADLQLEVLDVPLRCPPNIVYEVKDVINGRLAIQGYNTSAAVVAPTDGPTVIRLLTQHRDGGSNHSKDSWTQNCEQCGRDMEKVLQELGVGQSNPYVTDAPSPLEYRDVFILTYNAVSRQSGFVQGLTKAHIPIQILGEDEVATEDVVLAKHNKVTVALYLRVLGLERKVIIVLGSGRGADVNVAHRLFSLSRSTAQVVYIEPRTQ